MSSHLRPDVLRALKTVSRVGSWAVAVSGALVLLGWAFDVAVLKSLRPSFATMKVNTAVGFLLTGAALLLQHRATPGRHDQRLARAFGGLVLLDGALSFVESISGADLGIDQRLLSDAGGGPHPGRMAAATAMGFVLLGSALLLDGGRQRRRPRLADVPALTAGLVALLALLGYFYGVADLYAVGPFSTVAIHTSTAFLVASVALLFARPEEGVARRLASEGPAGGFARRMLPASVLVPVLLGLLRQEGQRAGLYGPDFGIALFVTATIACFVVLTWWNASALSRTDTRRREAELAAREREEDLATTLHSIGDAVIAANAEGAVTRMNPVAEQLTGWSLGEAKGLHLDEVFRVAASDTGEPRESVFARVVREGRLVGAAEQVELLTRAGRAIPIAKSGAPIRDALDQPRGVVLVFRDMTEERSAERALLESQALFAGISESGIAGIVVSDDTGKITQANEAFQRIVGYSQDELRSGHIGPDTLTPPDCIETRARVRAQVKASGTAPATETAMLRKDGTRVPLLIAVARLDPQRTVTVVANLTDLKRAERDHARLDETAQRELAAREQAEANLRKTEEQLRHALKMEAVGRLAGAVAHDFNNLLAVILSYADLLLADALPTEQHRADLEEIRSAATRAAELTGQLLTFSRQQVVAPKVLDLNDVLARTRKMLGTLVGGDVELLLTRAASGGRVRIDPGSIEQVLINLAVNARDAMPDGGTLTIETADVELDEAYAQAHLGVKPGPHVRLAVRDTGSGMDSATRSHIFEPFFTTKPQGKGTGLGLSTVFGIVQRSGGSIWVDSEPGAGATFEIYLPRVDAPVDAATTSTSHARLRGSETVLLVDDQDQVRAVARSILERSGYQVLEARGGDEALSLVERHAGPIDLLLSDVVMPQMSGPELARRLASARSSMRILFMSGYADDALVRYGPFGAGVAFIQKPFTPETLTRKIREVLEETSRPR